MRKVLTKGRTALFSGLVTLGLTLAAYGCTGPTSLSGQGGSEQYAVDIKMDPLTLNPPQLGTLTFEVRENANGKVVNAFEPVAGALLHNVIMSRDLEFFRHDAAQHLVLDQASVSAYFPSMGTYYTYALYKPVGAPVQQFKSTIVSGSESEEAQLVEETSRSSRADSQLSIVKVTNGLSVGWVKGTESIKAGQPSQLLFHVTERGAPVTSLWPLYDAPAHLWLVDSDANEFTHLMGTAQSRVLIPDATPAAGTTQGEGSSSQPIPREVPGGGGTPMPVPTLIPSLRGALATVTSIPYPTLLPVQKTPQADMGGVQDVRPATGYGPDVVFTHTFPHEGMYKMWLEVKWRDQIVATDFVVRVEK